MVKKFFGNLLLLVFANLLIKPLWVLGIDRTVQNLMGTEAYGRYYELFNTTFLLAIMRDMGINNYNRKVISRHPQIIHKNLSGILVVKLLLAAAYLLITLLIGLFSGYTGMQMYLLLLLCFNQILSWYILYLRTNISALQLFKTDTFLSVLDRLLMIVFCSILLFTPLRNDFQITYFVYAQTAAYLLTALVCLVFVSKHTTRIKLGWNFPLLLVIIKRSYPYALLAFLMVVYTRIDAKMMYLILPDSEREIGLYAAAYRLLDAVNMLGILVASLLLPLFLKMLKQKESLDKLVNFSFTLVVLPAILLAAYSWQYKEQVMSALYVNTAPQSGMIFLLLMLSFIPICTIYVYGTLLTANESLALLNKVALLSLLLNIVLNLWLIPQYKALGAACTSLITQSFVAGCHMFFSYRKVTLKVNPLLWLKIAVAAIMLFALAGWLRTGVLTGLTALVLPAVAAGIMALVLNLFDRKNVLNILKGNMQR
ncbi:MAG: polysaccharide biosynthesis C-terminal domain-containing protein [Bacteroidia bacterium]|nr:polysaccharide biosynthesis C-terminal domain-containing protein [Bacteroidia bacterium]